MLSHIPEQVPTFQSRKDSILIERSFRTSPYRKSGQAILIREIFTLDHADNLQLGKPSTIPFRVLKRKARLEQIQLAGPPSKKSTKQLILSTQNTPSQNSPIQIARTSSPLYFHN